ncbi:MAG: hypothetical protein HFJ10_00810 [Lachnospiraceae bacterium]|nr:hypothetical protein [Lachnospiraceae bacterium]
MKKQVIAIFSALTGAAVGAAAMKKIFRIETDKAKTLSDKHWAMFLMMNQWIQAKQEGKSLEEYFIKNNYKKIAVYGMSYVGERLIEELKGSEIKVAYGIDRNAGGLYADVDIVSPDDSLEDVDAVIVTSIFYMEEIEMDLSDKLSCPIVSLEDILNEMQQIKD